MSTYVLVRSDTARDFDDIYEGERLEVISTSEDLKKELSDRFGILNWDTDERNRVTGYKSDGSVRVEFPSGENGQVPLLTIIDGPKEDVEKMRDDLCLTILD